MTDRPILFSGPMVRALLDGRKTQTRRIVKGVPLQWLDDSGFTPAYVADPGNALCPYGVPGDRLWVRESHYLTDNGDEEFAVYAADPAEVGRHLVEVASLEAAHRDIDWSRHRKLRPSIHMPRWASRLTLAITDVRVERLQDISEADAEAEGVREPSLGEWVSTGLGEVPRDRCAPVTAFAALWEAINGPDSWAANPWVWAVTFEVERAG